MTTTEAIIYSIIAMPAITLILIMLSEYIDWTPPAKYESLVIYAEATILFLVVFIAPIVGFLMLLPH